MSFSMITSAELCGIRHTQLDIWQASCVTVYMLPYHRRVFAVEVSRYIFIQVIQSSKAGFYIQSRR
jgi:hypothetical protein